jgi:hypothetical protein
MVHSCNVHCHAYSTTETELLGMEDPGKWLPFSFVIATVIAMKQTTDEEEEPTFNCTTIFMDNGESFVIDTPFYVFQKVWSTDLLEEDEDSKSDNLTI